MLADSFERQRMLLVDDLDITADGVVWFSDASSRFPVEEYMLDFWEGRGTGRLFSIALDSGELKLHLDGLMFANGVALGPDDEYVLVTETLAARIVRLWLDGPRAGESEVFIAALPGSPDNMSFNEKGTFWVAIPSPRQHALEGMAGSPFIRRIVVRLPEPLRTITPPPLGWVIGLDGSGKVLHSLQDPTGSVHTVTSVNEFDGALYMGSIAMDTVGRVSAPAE